MAKTTPKKTERRSTFERTWPGEREGWPERRMAPRPPRAMMRRRKRGEAPSGPGLLVAVRRVVEEGGVA